MNTILMSDVEKVRLFQSGQLTKLRKKLPETKYIREDAPVFMMYDYATGEPPLFKQIDPRGVMETICAKYIVGDIVYIREPWAYAKSLHQWTENGILKWIEEGEQADDYMVVHAPDTASQIKFHKDSDISEPNVVIDFLCDFHADRILQYAIFGKIKYEA